VRRNGNRLRKELRSMDQETIKALTRISEVEAERKTLEGRLGELTGELEELWETARAGGVTRTRPRKAEAKTPAKKGAEK
jgi:uncharacterized coiled-coil DUF342 family protein